MLTVVFATHNGSDTLHLMLDAMTKLKAPETGWKLIAVDNGSTDNTPDILRSYVGLLPLMVMEQPERGKNRALNLALEHVDGDLIVLTDDDVVPTPDWLCQIRQGADTNPQYDLFGGAILPLWLSEPPTWLIENVPVGIAYAITQAHKIDGPTSPGLIWGPNMAIRRKVFDAGHRFDESVGPGPGRYRMGSETEFTTRLSGLGYGCWHLPHAKVSHIIQPHQLEPTWLIERAYRFGRDMFYKEFDPSLASDGHLGIRNAPTILGLPRWAFRLIGQQAVVAAWSRLVGNRAKWIQARWDVAYWHGYLREGFTKGAVLRRVRKDHIYL